ncbi:MAG: hypothetical protein Q9224_001598 [Gallowayella concinna]
MFLIEDNRKAILYTGDIRAEPWWVDSISRQPTIIPYTHGLRRLDRIYLDTTFAINKDPYRNFSTKAQGLSELLGEISKFPEDTSFHFNAWTLGYEEVWVALAAHLNCELGTRCSTLETSKNLVWITPLINRSDQGDIPELGAGGGGGDLTQAHELELTDPQAGLKLIELCKEQIRDDAILFQTLRLVEDALCSSKRTVALNSFNDSLKGDVIPLERIASLLIQVLNQKDRSEHPEGSSAPPSHRQNAGRVQFTFEAESGNARSMESWTPEISVEGLFGHLCTGNIFLHDLEMRFIHDVGTSPALGSSPRRSSCEKASSIAPRYPLCGPEMSNDCIDSPLASDQPGFGIADASGMESSSTRLAKRRGTGEIRLHKKSRMKLQEFSQEYSQRQQKCVLARSFSGWLSPVGREPLATDPTMSESAREKNMKTTPKREQSQSPPVVPSDRNGEVPRGPQSHQTHKLQGESSLLEPGHQGLIHNNRSSSPASTIDEIISTGNTPRKSGAGTQTSPVELSDKSGSDTEADTDQDGTTQIDDRMNENNSGSGSGTPLSVADSMFESQELSPSSSNPTRGSNPHRIWYRKEIYKAVKRDGGDVWGKEYSLLSTAGDDDDDLEL